MTHQATTPSTAPGADPGRQVAQLREALRLVEGLAGRNGDASRDDRRLGTQHTLRTCKCLGFGCLDIHFDVRRRLQRPRAGRERRRPTGGLVGA